MTDSHESASGSTQRVRGAFSLSRLPSLSLIAMIGWLLGRYKRRRVRGNSMLPTLEPGQEVLIKPLAGAARNAINPGDLLYVQHPLDSSRQIIKRCSHCEGTKVWLVGDNSAESTDSRSYGALPAKFILGKLICTFP